MKSMNTNDSYELQISESLFSQECSGKVNCREKSRSVTAERGSQTEANAQTMGVAALIRFPNWEHKKHRGTSCPSSFPLHLKGVQG